MHDTRDLQAFLGRVRLFEGLQADLLEKLANCATELTLEPRDILFNEGDPGSELFLVREGRLAVTVSRNGLAPRKINSVAAGECVGEMGLFAGGRRFTTVTAETETRLVKLECRAIEDLLDEVPEVKKVVGRIIERRLPKLRAALHSLFGELDESVMEEIEGTLTWRRLIRGEALFREGEPGDEMYFIVHGRLSVVGHSESAGRVITELGPSEWVGEMALIDNQPRSATVAALRDTDLLGLSRAGFEKVVAAHPAILLPMLKVLSKRLRRVHAIEHTTIPPKSLTVAIVPLSPLPADFIETLTHEFTCDGKVLALTAGAFDDIHGRSSAQTPAHDPRSSHFSSWLSGMEAEYEYVLYIADNISSEWAKRCMRNADRVLFSIDFNAARQGEHLLTVPEMHLVDATKTVVFWHESDVTLLPTHTAGILAGMNVSRFHHVRKGRNRDVQRVARFLMNRSIGLCLSGGGARGFAHIGVYRALVEAGIPVDRVGGTSVGGFISALIACQFDYKAVVEHARHVLAERDAFGWTLPFVSLLQVRNAERRLREIFGESDYEDMSLPAFCCCTNLTTSQVAIMRSGPVWRAVRATTAIPGLCPPVFIRGEVFVDGGVLDNLPVDEMMQDMPGPIIACDVTRGSTLRVNPHLESTPSALHMVSDRILGGRAENHAPSVGDILISTMVCNSRLRQKTNMQIAAAYLTPPVHDYRLLDMRHFDKLVEAGYRYASEFIATHRLNEICRYRLDLNSAAAHSATAG